VGEGVNETSHSKILQVVLVSPQIPGNTAALLEHVQHQLLDYT